MSGAVKIDRRLYLTADASRVVGEGDPEAATLLCPAGGEVPYATAARYGLLDKSEAEAEEGPESDADSESEKKAPTAANKAARRPADKSRTAEGDK